MTRTCNDHPWGGKQIGPWTKSGVVLLVLLLLLLLLVLLLLFDSQWKIQPLLLTCSKGEGRGGEGTRAELNACRDLQEMQHLQCDSNFGKLAYNLRD